MDFEVSLCTQINQHTSHCWAHGAFASMERSSSAATCRREKKWGGWGDVGRRGDGLAVGCFHRLRAAVEVVEDCRRDQGGLVEGGEELVEGFVLPLRRSQQLANPLNRKRRSAIVRRNGGSRTRQTTSAGPKWI